jgi:phage tail-like protein
VKMNAPGISQAWGAVHAGFMSVSGLNINTEVIPYREGGMNTTTQKMPGQSDFSPITFSRGLIITGTGSGVTNDPAMAWQRRLFAVMQGTGTGAAGQDFRVNLDIKVLAHPVTNKTVEDTPVKAHYRVYNAWPTSVAFGDLDAGANAIMTQQIVFAHEGFDFRLDDSSKGAKTSLF